MKVALSYRVDLYPAGEGLTKSQMKRAELVPVETYARSVHYELEQLGHTVDNVYGQEFTNQSYYDVYLELDNGRAPDGKLHFAENLDKVTIPKAVWFVDSHGQPDLHHLLAPHYNHVFFAVWARRELFTGHPSAHWCPNATDTRFFYPIIGEPQFDFGFFGSQMGLDRADKMIDICEKQGWATDVRQIGGGPFKHKWPRTCHAMNGCATLFNCGQKHDGPNLRVLESMAIRRPLITEVDPKNGMDKLFVEGEHYLGYEAYTFKGLEEKMLYAKAHPGWSLSMAQKAYDLVVAKHLVKHRVVQMLEVFGA
jgi:hypothetical protein